MCRRRKWLSAIRLSSVKVECNIACHWPVGRLLAPVMAVGRLLTLSLACPRTVLACHSPVTRLSTLSLTGLCVWVLPIVRRLMPIGRDLPLPSHRRRNLQAELCATSDCLLPWRPFHPFASFHPVCVLSSFLCVLFPSFLDTLPPSATLQEREPAVMPRDFISLHNLKI